MELAANLVIEAELVHKKSLPREFANHLMIWANGLRGKFEKLIYPILREDPAFSQIRSSIDKVWRRVNKQRNSVAHSGAFKKRKTAFAAINDAHFVITQLVSPYDSSFNIEKLDKTDRDLAAKRKNGRNANYAETRR